MKLYRLLKTFISIILKFRLSKNIEQNCHFLVINISIGLNIYFFNHKNNKL